MTADQSDLGESRDPEQSQKSLRDKNDPSEARPGASRRSQKGHSGVRAGGYPGEYPGQYPGVYPGEYIGALRNERAESDDEEVDLRALWRTFVRYWRAIAGLIFVVGVLATFYAQAQTPIFLASAKLMIDNQKANTVSIDEVYGVPVRDKEYLSTQFEVIKSRDIAKRAVEELNLIKHPLYKYSEPDPPWWSQQWAALRSSLTGLVTFRGEGPNPVAETVESQSDVHAERIVSRFMEALSVAPIRDTSLVSISFESPDPELAARVPNTMAKVYVESQLDAELESTRAASAWLSSRVGELYTALSKSQQELQAFRDEENLVDIQGVETLAVQELQELISRLSEARRARSTAETIYNEVHLDSSRDINDLMDSPVVLQHPLVQGPAQDESTAAQLVERLEQRYGPEHPKMIEALTALDGARLALRARVEQVIAGIKSEYRIAKANEASIAEQLNSVKAEVAKLNRQKFRLQELERKVDADQRLYEMFFNRVRETSEVSSFQEAPARIVEHAVVPRVPVKPNKKLIVIAAVFISLFIGFGLALLAEAFNQNIRTADDVFRELQTPLLAIVPLRSLAKEERGRPYFGVVKAPSSIYAEAFRTLRTSLLLGREDKSCHVTLVTSGGASEGKSSTSENLAYVLSKMGRTLLIEADLRKPSFHKQPELYREGRIGLADLLTDQTSLADALLSWDTNLETILAGKPCPRDSLELLSSERFNKLITFMRERYDYIVIDSPPLGLVTDALVLARHADSTVFVVRSGTPTNVAKSSLERLRQGGLPVDGVLLNMLDAKEASYGTRYGLGYGYGYGYGHKEQEAYGANEA